MAASHSGSGFDMQELGNQESDRESTNSNKEGRTHVEQGPSKAVTASTDETLKDKVKKHLNKGNLSNLATFLIMIIGIAMVVDLNGDAQEAGRWILAFGLFGFAGGVTNWLAVKMLFDRVPLLYGSGVIPRRFKEIRQVVKDTIMKTFFDEEYLNKYMEQKLTELTTNLDIDDKIKEILESEAVDEIIDKNLADLSQRPEGMWMTMMGLTPEKLKPTIKPFILGMGTHVGPLLVTAMGSNNVISVDSLRMEIDRLMTQKLQELTPQVVKKLMEDVIREHLGWLIVWGNVFGGVIGLISKGAGY